MRRALEKFVRAVFYTLAWVATYFFVVSLAAPKAHGQESAPSVSCVSNGHEYTCVSHGAESLDLLPFWTMHTPRKFTSYGLDFTAKAPKRWTRVTVEFYLNDGSTVTACFDVSRVDGRAKLRKPCLVGE